MTLVGHSFKPFAYVIPIIIGYPKSAPSFIFTYASRQYQIISICSFSIARQECWSNRSRLVHATFFKNFLINLSRDSDMTQNFIYYSSGWKRQKTGFSWIIWFWEAILNPKNSKWHSRLYHYHEINSLGIFWKKSHEAILNGSTSIPAGRWKNDDFITLVIDNRKKAIRWGQIKNAKNVKIIIKNCIIADFMMKTNPKIKIM